MKEIMTTRGMVALVDDEDYDDLIKYSWRAVGKEPTKMYAVRSFWVGKKVKCVKMHRQILGITDSTIFIDHANFNTIDNQRKNLRICNRNQNAANKNRLGLGRSKYLGVTIKYSKVSNLTFYIAFWRIKNKSRQKTLPTEIEAAKYRDKMAKKIYGEFATLNFPNQ